MTQQNRSLRVVVGVVALLAGCGDEALRPLDASTTTCEGPEWQFERALGDRWSDSGGEAAESGGEVLAVWTERDENGFENAQLMAVVLDAATGEELRTFSAPGGMPAPIWVRAVDGGFYVFVMQSWSVAVHFVPHGGERLEYVTMFEVSRSHFDVVTTALGVLALTEDGVHSFDHFGVAGAVFNDRVLRGCAAGTLLRDGRVFAWCTDWQTEQGVFVTMNADGSEPAELPGTRRSDDLWSSRVAAADAGVFYVDAGYNELTVRLLDDTGVALTAPVPVPLQAHRASDEAYIIGAGGCTSTCEGPRIVVEGNTALLEVVTFDPEVVERFLLHTDGGVVTVESLGVRESYTRASLNPAQPGALSLSTRHGWSLPWDWPPQTLVVERTCLRRPIDEAG